MEATQVKPIGKNILLFFKETEVNDKHTFDSGVEIYVDTSFEPTFSAKDSAHVYSVGKKTIIPCGATAYVDYMVHTQSDNKALLRNDDGVYYMAEEKDVFLWEKGNKAQTIGNWIVVEMDEKESLSTKSVIIMPEKKQETYGTVRFVNDKLENDFGLKVGDKVMVNEKYNYAFQYKGKELMRVDFNIGLHGTRI